jgi:hypothetical protein
MPTRAELQAELDTLELREKHLSAERRRLHDQIDKGFANDPAVAREQSVSAERRTLHQRISELRDLLRDRGR